MNEISVSAGLIEEFSITLGVWSSSTLLFTPYPRMIDKCVSSVQAFRHFFNVWNNPPIHLEILSRLKHLCWLPTKDMLAITFRWRSEVEYILANKTAYQFHRIVRVHCWHGWVVDFPNEWVLTAGINLNEPRKCITSWRKFGSFHWNHISFRSCGKLCIR